MKRKGFTLIELLAVIIILGLLATIAVPSSLKISKKIKERVYTTKISTIETAAKNYGTTNLSSIRRGINPLDTTSHHTCVLSIEDDEITKVTYYSKSEYSEDITLGENEYWCIKLTVNDLVTVGELNYDEENNCSECTTDELKSYYDNIVVDSTNNYIINRCNVYIYYKYGRAYAYFDRNQCDIKTDIPNDDGQEYDPTYCLKNSC